MNPYVYASFFDYAVEYDAKRGVFDILYGSRGQVAEAKITGLYRGETNIAKGKDLSVCAVTRSYAQNAVILTASFKNVSPDLSVNIEIALNGVTFFPSAPDIKICVEGTLFWGEDMEKNTFAVAFDREGEDLRAALGPAASTADNALFDRASGEALCFSGGGNLRLCFDWARSAYRFRVKAGERGAALLVKKEIYQTRYGVDYKSINKNGAFQKPPSGWMTWYAVKFDACEKAVLDNARFQAEQLKDFGADTVWVDWEWYHKDLTGVRDDGTDCFHPDKEKYPNGLKYVSDEIKKLGLIPALWVGFTNDGAENDYIKANKDAVLAQTPQWCGQYFLDISHPKFLNDYIPRTFSQVLEWGYEALKWDCLPITLKLHDEYRQNMYDRSVPVRDAFRKAIMAGRAVVGEDFYMLSCSAERTADVLYAADLFDAARIGGDIFTWAEFIRECVEKVMMFYPLHNILFYNDPDNVILREEFNTFDQARSRACFVSLLGLPITLGDVLPELGEKRLELLKRTLPTIDAHPMDIREMSHASKLLKTNLAIETRFERWNVAGVLNLAEESVKTELDLKNDLHLEQGNYLIFDYWRNTFLGETEKSVSLELKPCETRVLSVRRKLGRPQLLSASRHITQGAAEIKTMLWDPDTLTLSGVSEGVRGDEYTLSFYVPKGYTPPEKENARFERCKNGGVLRLAVIPQRTGELSWAVSFGKDGNV